MKTEKHQSNRRSFLKKSSLGLVGSTVALSAFGNEYELESEVPNSLEMLRRQLGLKEGLVYLNTGSLGPSTQWVRDRVNELTIKLEENPVSNNWGELGKTADAVRQTIADFINAASPDEIFLTRNTTEGMNLIAQGLDLKEGDEVLTTTDEHLGGLSCWNFLQKYHGVVVKQMKFPRKDLNPKEITDIIEENITEKTKVLSLMDVCTITGMRMPMKEVAAIAEQKEILLVCDGAQSAGMMNVDVREMGVDTFATSGHKWLMGPKETGFVYIKKEAQERIKPMQLEYGFKIYTASNGTRNVANLIGLGEAVQVQKNIGRDVMQKRILELSAYMKKKLAELPDLQIISPSDPYLQSGLTSVILIQKDVGEAYEALKFESIIVKRLHDNVMRLSTHAFTTEADIDRFAASFSEILKS